MNCVRSLFLAAALIAADARADTVSLANGDRLSGKLIHASPQQVTLQTEYAGKVTIRRSNIVSIATDAPVEALLEGAQAPAATWIGPGAVPQERVTFVNPTPAESGLGVAYQGRVSLSAARTSGNTSTERAYGEGEFTARAKSYRYLIGAQVRQEADAGQDTVSNWIANANYDWFVAKDRFVYTRGSLERDRFRDIDQRATLGGGYGLQLYETKATELSLRGGLDYVALDRTVDASEHYPALGWGLRFSHWLWNRTVQVFHNQDGFWNLEDTSQATLRSGTGLRVPIAAGLTANAQFNLDWEKKPAPGFKPRDTALHFGVGYEW